MHVNEALQVNYSIDRSIHFQMNYGYINKYYVHDSVRIQSGVLILFSSNECEKVHLKKKSNDTILLFFNL